MNVISSRSSVKKLFMNSASVRILSFGSLLFLNGVLLAGSRGIEYLKLLMFEWDALLTTQKNTLETILYIAHAHAYVSNKGARSHPNTSQW